MGYISIIYVHVQDFANVVYYEGKLFNMHVNLLNFGKSPVNELGFQRLNCPFCSITDN